LLLCLLDILRLSIYLYIFNIYLYKDIQFFILIILNIYKYKAYIYVMTSKERLHKFIHELENEKNIVYDRTIQTSTSSTT
jgi:hypothetical protein